MYLCLNLGFVIVNKPVFVKMSSNVSSYQHAGSRLVENEHGRSLGLVIYLFCWLVLEFS